MADKKKVIKGKVRTVHTGKKGGKYYVSKGKKVYFGGGVFSTCKKPPCKKKSKGQPRRIERSPSSSSSSKKSSTPAPSTLSKRIDSWVKKGYFVDHAAALASLTDIATANGHHALLPVLADMRERSSKKPKKPVIDPPSFYINMMYNSKGKPIPIPSDISSKELKRAINEGRLFMSNVGLPPKFNKTSYKKPPGKSIREDFIKKVGNRYVWASINQFAANPPSRGPRPTTRAATGGPDMNRMIPKSYRVPSTDFTQRGLPSLLYTVDYNPGDETYNCSCPNYFMMNEKNTGKKTMLPLNRGCKHIRGVNDGTLRKYPGRDVNKAIRRQILQDQLDAGERHPATSRFLEDDWRMDQYLTSRVPPYGINGFTRPEQENSLAFFKKYAPPRG